MNKNPINIKMCEAPEQSKIDHRLQISKALQVFLEEGGVIEMVANNEVVAPINVFDPLGTENSKLNLPKESVHTSVPWWCS